MIRSRHLRLGAHFLAHRWRELHPFEVQAVLLYACNLKCDYCYCPELSTRLLDTEQWIEALRGLGRFGTSRIKFQGGEPTLRRDFREIASAAKGLGMRTAVVTNGSRIARDPSLLEPLDELVVSVDSLDPEIHDEQRGRGNHAEALAAIDAGLARDLAVFAVAVVTKRNVEDLPRLLEFCESKGVLLNPQPALFGKKVFDERARPIALSGDQVRDLYRRLAAWRREGRGLVFSAASYDHGARWKDYDELTRRGDFPSRCMAGKYYVQIEPNGDVWPCQSCGADFRARNLVADGLEEALRHATRHDCVDCYGSYLVERRLLFGFRPSALVAELRRG